MVKSVLTVGRLEKAAAAAAFGVDAAAAEDRPVLLPRRVTVHTVSLCCSFLLSKKLSFLQSSAQTSYCVIVSEAGTSSFGLWTKKWAQAQGLRERARQARRGVRVTAETSAVSAARSPAAFVAPRGFSGLHT